MTEEHKLEIECIKAAQTLVGEKLQVDFQKVTQGKTLAAHMQKKFLFSINTELAFNNYVSQYSNKYHEIYGKQPEKIIFYQCHIYSNLGSGIYNVDCVECKLELASNHLQSIHVIQIINSDVSLESGIPNPLEYTKLIRGSYFHNGTKIRAHQSKPATEIINCIFKENLLCHTPAIIHNCKIQKLGSAEASLESEISDSHIEECALTQVRSIIIKDSSFKRFSIQSSRQLKRAMFSNIIFESAPIFEDTEFETRNVSFLNISIKKLFGGKALGAFRSLKKLCEDAHYETGIIMFHGFELETYYNTFLKGKSFGSPEWPEMVSSYMHNRFTDYGRDLMRPFWLLLVFFVIGFFVNVDTMENLDIHCASLVSLKNTLGPLASALIGIPGDTKDIVPEGYIGKIWGFSQIITCSTLWFLILFMIRRRFKL